MKHRLTRRLVLYFSVTLLVFALAIGGVFGFLFRRYTLELNTNDLLTHAEAIAASLSGKSMGNAPAESGDSLGTMPHGRRGGRHGMMMRRMGPESAAPQAQAKTEPHAATSPHMYCRRRVADNPALSAKGGNEDSDGSLASLIRQLNAFTGGEVWIVDRAARTITMSGAEAGTDYTELPPNAETRLEEIFAGNTVAGESFNAMLDIPSVTAGAPIRDAEGNVTGALLMHRRLSDIHASETAGLQLLAVSLALAFLLAAVLSYLLARRFIRPLSLMEQTAAALADGKDETRSGVRQDDEIGSLAQSLDVLAQRLEEAAAERSKLDATRRDFFASISHELRTPLTVLRGSLDVLSSGLVTDEAKRQEYLVQMQANVLHLNRLVNDIFDLARLENPDFSIEKTEMDVSDALRDAVRSARRLATPMAVELRLADAPPIPARGDYGRLRQMFLAVLDNAVKFSPEGAAVEIGVELSGGRWRITVADHGPGIAADLLPHIFDRFRTRREGGTGLGLAIAQEIARRHDIVLEADSAEGQGAIFAFRGYTTA
ncbi:MAG: HAMP domain-containing histidine kinase [Schwartzia sp.]|nr:HAMP domain-containing histidine kinase [Schwartzia sp. (in: firmicutes)]